MLYIQYSNGLYDMVLSLTPPFIISVNSEITTHHLHHHHHPSLSGLLGATLGLRERD